MQKVDFLTNFLENVGTTTNRVGNLKNAKHSETPLGVTLSMNEQKRENRFSGWDGRGVNPRKMIAKQLKRIALTLQSPNVK